jgi:hypothetical protein
VSQQFVIHIHTGLYVPGPHGERRRVAFCGNIGASDAACYRSEAHACKACLRERAVYHRWLEQQHLGAAA